MNISLINVLAAASNADMTFGERLGFGGQMLLIGMVTVFSVLVILMLVLILFKLFAYTIPNKIKENKKVEPEKEEHQEPAAPVIETNNNNDEELVAVITAAIEAYNSANGNSLPFRVVSFKRVKGANGWNGNIE